MQNVCYRYETVRAAHEMEMIYVEGTNGAPYLFGVPGVQHEVQLGNFFIGKFPVTQELFQHIMGEAANNSVIKGDNRPVENISWNEITKQNGLLDMINASQILKQFNEQLGRSFRFRLPSETEWEYAARGGVHWKDGFTHSGSNDVNLVAWYRDNSIDHMHEVGLKAPNQLGIYEMSGNQWEWCQDLFTRDTRLIPMNGLPYEASGTDRVLRGGCFHNYSMHCTVSKRYEIGPEFGDGCIGLRLVLA